MSDLAADLAVTLDPGHLAARVGLVLDDWQAAALASTAPRQLWCCTRQAGKTTTSALRALATAVTRPGSLTLAVAPAQRQSLELLHKVRDYAMQYGAELIGDSQSRLEFRTARASSGSRARKRPHEASPRPR
jgi:hypothetical protein